jgi:hypothetical protein
MKIVLLKILLILFVLEVQATAQMPDKIIYKGIEYNLFSNPLETYFEKNPNKRPIRNVGGVIVQSSSLWRGYLATFEIKDSTLFVKDVQILYSDSSDGNSHVSKWKSVINEVFHERQEMKANWFSGLLVLSYGKLINYVHMGYASTYENYILLEINEGVLKKVKHFNSIEYEKFKERQFQAFKKTKEYKMTKKELIKDGKSKKIIDSFLRSFITKYTTKILIE